MDCSSPSRSRGIGSPDVLDPRDPDPTARARLRSWLAVQACFAFRPEAAAALLATTSDPEDLLRRAPGARPAPPALGRARDALARVGARLIPLPSPLYPARLRRLSDAPALLAVRGDPGALGARCVSLVGARAPTAYGRSVAGRLAGGLARAGLVIVSGLARGIDAVAHRSALEVEGATLAFLACGPEQVYPREHDRLARRIAASGAVVSEFPVGTPPRAAHFPLRNRLISALAEALVVVEARERSGSLITARHAADQGVEVLAVPGPIDASTSWGPNRLIRDGAGVVTGVGDVLEELGLSPRSAEPAGSAPASALGSRQREILRALAGAPLYRDELGRRLACAASELALALFELELEGLVVEDRDGRLRAISPLRGPRL